MNAPSPAAGGTVAVYGASGHTGRFVMDALARRGLAAVAVGRRADPRHGATARVAAIDDPAALARAFAGCAVVINCAGPFLDTAAPVADAALSAGSHYIDVTAEQASAQATLRDYDRAARERGVAVVPAAGFYGGLADLLASALARESAITRVTVAVGLDRWWPTPGTRATGERNRFPRVVIEDGRQVELEATAPGLDWAFGAPFGRMALAQVPLSEVVTIAHHLDVRALRSYLSTEALQDLRDPATPAPEAADAQGRSPQRFAMEVVLDDAAGTRRASASGQDIYAVSAPLLVEAAVRLLAPGAAHAGALTLGQAFDAGDFLRALSPEPFLLGGDLS